MNMDEGLLDGEYAMKKFLNMLIPEPDISKVPRVIVRDGDTLTPNPSPNPNPNPYPYPYPYPYP